MPVSATSLLSRRSAIRAVVADAARWLLHAAIAGAQTTPSTPGTGPLGPGQAPTTTTTPPRDFTAPSVYFSDPDVLTIDSNFSGFQGNATIARLWHGDVNGKPILWARPRLELAGPVPAVQ